MNYLIGSTVALLTFLGTCASAQTLQLIQKIPLPNVEGRIDHMSAYGKGLFVAAVGNNSLEVVDLSTGKIVQSIKVARTSESFQLAWMRTTCSMTTKRNASSSAAARASSM